MRKRDAEIRPPEVPKPFEVEGYLNKQGAVGAIKTWKKRYFSTKNGNLFYAKSHPTEADEDPETLGLISIPNTTSIDLEGGLGVEVRTTSRNYRLEAASKEDAVLWVASLRKIREHYKGITDQSQQKGRPVIVEGEEQPSSSEREGFLSKKGFFNKALQERYFILTGGFLYYYTPSDAGQHFRGKISMLNTHVTKITSTDPDDDGCFSIVTKFVPFSFLSPPSPPFSLHPSGSPLLETVHTLSRPSLRPKWRTGLDH